MYEGKFVRLRELRKEDTEKALEYINDPEVKRCLTPGSPFLLTLQDEEKWVNEQSAFKDTYNFAIEDLEEKEYIGGCGINHVDWKNRVATVGIWLKKSHWNKGYGTDAMTVLVGFIFEQMNINKVQLHVYSFNQRARKSYEKSGFKVDGVLRQHIFRDGKYHDEYVLSILSQECFQTIE